jgi:hypothetical protein
MSPDYQKSKIYKIINTDNNKDIYVGSTCKTLEERYSEHKRGSKKHQKKNYPLYQAMNNTGHEKFKIELICDYPCNSMDELRQKEGEYIQSIGTLNCLVAGRSWKQYYQENKETIKQKVKEYYTNHKEERLQYCKNWNIENKEIVQEKQKEYYDANKDIIKSQKKEVIVCECGCLTTRGHITRHIKTKKHQNIMQNK